ncbi:MFS transporter [Rhodophyticola porphyridii]|uniref:MFS transporter n=1 Tax=Rhodophyticola porphyridii TaxID=1852017 RepID=UPI0035CF63E7
MPGFCASEARPFILFSAILASALGFIDGTLVAIALPAMRDGLNATLVQAQWINNGYLLPLSALILIGGAIGDRYGLARVFAAGIAGFVLASLACAVAPTPETLIVARVFQGIGAAVMVPGSLALIARAYPAEERGRTIGIWAAASALTTALGPILGGLVLSFGGTETWRLLFAINLPLGALALWMILTKVAADPARPDHPLDLPGAALITGALALIALGLTGASEGHAVNWTPALVGAALFAGFLAWEARSPAPMVPLDLFRNASFSAANGATFLIYFALSTVLFFLPMTLIAGWGQSEVVSAAAFAPLSIFIPLLSTRAGKWADDHGPGPLIAVGGGLVALAFAGLAITTPLQAFWIFTLPCTALMGLGMALVVAPLSAAIMGAVPEDRSGTASGINNAVSRVSGLVAVAVMGTLAGAIYAGAGGTGSFGAFSDTVGHAAAMNTAFATLCWVTAALTALGAGLSWLFIRNED